MNDLIRLMFDDGAERKPIGHTGNNEIYYFKYNGTEYMGRLWTKDTFGESRSMNGWWFYRDDLALDNERLERFQEDPDKWASRFGVGWGVERVIHNYSGAWRDAVALMEIIEL